VARKGSRLMSNWAGCSPAGSVSTTVYDIIDNNLDKKLEHAGSGEYY